MHIITVGSACSDELVSRVQDGRQATAMLVVEGLAIWDLPLPLPVCLSITKQCANCRLFSDIFTTERPLAYHSECSVYLCNSSGTTYVVKSYRKDALSTASKEQVIMQSMRPPIPIHLRLLAMTVTLNELGCRQLCEGTDRSYCHYRLQWR